MAQQKNEPKNYAARSSSVERAAYLRKLYLLLGLIVVLLLTLVLLLPNYRTSATKHAEDAEHADEAVGEFPTERSDPPAGVDVGRPEPDFRDDDIPESTPGERPPVERPPAVSEADPAPAEPVPPAISGEIYLILDDAGYTVRELEPFFELEIPLTVSVLPHLPFSVAAAEATRSAGHDVMLHMPMEPIRAGDPGPGAILMDDSVETVRLRVREAVLSVPYAVAANNHMGSGVTSRYDLMSAVIDELSQSGLFFVDSRTSADSVVADVSASLGMPELRRHVFVDHDRSIDAMRAALRDGVERAMELEYAILIGHVQTDALGPLLREAAEYAADRGVVFRSISELQRRYARALR